MEELVEDFLQYLRNERGLSEETQRLYSALLRQFITWAGQRGLKSWQTVELSHLTDFLRHEQQRPLQTEPEGSKRRLSASSLYLVIAALRSFYKFCHNEDLLP